MVVEQADIAVQFVNCSVCFNPNMAFGNFGAANERGFAQVTGFSINLLCHQYIVNLVIVDLYGHDLPIINNWLHSDGRIGFNNAVS